MHDSLSPPYAVKDTRDEQDLILAMEDQLTALGWKLKGYQIRKFSEGQHLSWFLKDGQDLEKQRLG